MPSRNPIATGIRAAMKKADRLTQSESASQIQLFQWADACKHRWPELECLYAIPNQARRDPRNGARMKREGCRAGIPDLCLPVARGGHSALFIEMKRPGGRVTDLQHDWHERLFAWGNKVLVCHSFDEARAAIERYLSS